MSILAQRRATMQEGGAVASPPSFIAASSIFPAGTGTSAICPMPLVNGGDFCIGVSISGGVSGNNTPAGWTKVLGDIAVPSVGGNVAVFTHIAGGTVGVPTTDGAQTFTFVSSGERGAYIVGYRGVSALGAKATGTQSGATNGTTPTITTTVANAMVVRGVGICGGVTAAPTWSWASSTKELDASSVAATFVAGSSADKVQASAGAAGTEVATASRTESGVLWTVELQP